jgi:hypothetical protein
LDKTNQKVQTLSDFEYIGPLFTAYDEKITILENRVEEMREDLESVELKGQLIIEENNYFRKELEKKCH